MIYPNFIKDNDTIGIAAPSDGISNNIDLQRLDEAKKTFNAKNIKIYEPANCRNRYIGRSGTAIERARQLENLFLDNTVNGIICLSGRRLFSRNAF